MKYEKGSPEHHAFLAHRREYLKARRAAMTPEQRDIERARCREYHAANREAELERMKKWREKNPNAARESSAAWRVANPGKQAVLNAAWKSANAKRYADYVANNKEAKNVKNKEWQKANQDRLRAYSATRRAKKKATGGKYTPSDIRDLRELQRDKCACCSQSLTDNFHVDHVIPLKAGGSNDRLNLQLLCASCNLSKGAKNPVDFMQERGFLL